MAATKFTISLNGSDNVGKTTALSLLNDAIPNSFLAGSVSAYDHRWPELSSNPVDFSKWWFTTSTTEEHTDLFFTSHFARVEDANLKDSPCVFEGRGLPMIIATCAATAVLKDGLDPGTALDHINALFSHWYTTYCDREGIQGQESRLVSVLLRRSSAPSKEAELSISREPHPSEIYPRYQLLLAQVIDLQRSRGGSYTHVLEIGDMGAYEVHDRLRLLLRDEYGIATEGLPRLPAQIWVLGGLSESGKSTVGALLHTSHGFVRLKIGYLLEASAHRAGLVGNLYDVWTPLQQAFHLALEIGFFARIHKASLISIESAHDFKMIECLKALCGPERCHILYLDASWTTRASRTSEDKDELASRDATKMSRGADQIQGIATVVDNEGTMLELRQKIANLVQAHAQAELTPFPSNEKNLITPIAPTAPVRAHFLSNEFLISAGCLLLKDRPAAKRRSGHKAGMHDIVLIHKRSTGEYLFPKGRKNIGETLEDAAIRETYEETGFRCKLFPLPIPTSAPSETKERKRTQNVEPLACSLRPAGDMQKIIYWYVGLVTGQHTSTRTQMADEDFENLVVPLEKASDYLEFPHDKEVVDLVIKLLGAD